MAPTRLALVRGPERLAVAAITAYLERLSSADGFARAVRAMQGREASMALVGGPVDAVKPWTAALYLASPAASVELAAVGRERLATQLAIVGHLALATQVRRWPEAPHDEGVVQLVLYVERGTITPVALDVREAAV